MWVPLIEVAFLLVRVWCIDLSVCTHALDTIYSCGTQLRGNGHDRVQRRKSKYLNILNAEVIQPACLQSDRSSSANIIWHICTKVRLLVFCRLHSQVESLGDLKIQCIVDSHYIVFPDHDVSFSWVTTLRCSPFHMVLCRKVLHLDLTCEDRASETKYKLRRLPRIWSFSRIKFLQFLIYKLFVTFLVQYSSAFTVTQQIPILQGDPVLRIHAPHWFTFSDMCAQVRIKVSCKS